MEEVNPLKETVLLGALNVGLPTFDVYSDIGLTANLYTSTATIPVGTLVNGTMTTRPITIDVSHPIYATTLFIPFLINYALGWRAWYYGDMRKTYNNDQRKMFSWIFALLGCYPQLVASRIMRIYWKQPQKAMKKKKHLERNVMENEVYTEAVPSQMIMTFLAVVFVFSEDPYEAENQEDGARVLVENAQAGSIGKYLFYATFASSSLSAGLGQAKCLKVRSFYTLKCGKTKH